MVDDQYLRSDLARRRAEALLDPRSNDELFQLALTMPDHETTEEESEAFWKAWDGVILLQNRGTKAILRGTRRLCRSSDKHERYVGVIILSQLRSRCHFRQEKIDELLRLLERETDPLVLGVVGTAFGHLHTLKAIPALRPLRRHSSVEVRRGVMWGLSHLEDRRAIRMLIELTSDEDDFIRDWATFAIGRNSTSDSKAIRKALWARIGDSDQEVRAEALAGLADRRVKGTISAMRDELSKDNLHELVIETADDLADPRLLPALLYLRSRYTEGMSFRLDQLEEAIQKCSG